MLIDTAMASNLSFVARVRAFSRRIAWFSRLTGGWSRAIRIILAIKMRPDVKHSVVWKAHRIYFRGKDEQALKEVLVDDEYAFLDPLLHSIESPRILDVGAHIGTFAAWCLDRNRHCQILSLEADPDTAGLTLINAEEHEAWVVQHGAAGARDGETVYLSVSGPSMSYHVRPDCNGVPVASVSLSTLLDTFAGQGGRVDLIKVDIEGSEEAFLCAEPSQLARVGALVVELHPRLCDTGRVQSALKVAFDNVLHVGGRLSTNPLLYCTRHGVRKS